MNLKTRMSKKKKKTVSCVKFTEESYLKYCFYVDFSEHLKLTMHIVQNLNLKTDSLAFEIVNLKIKLSRVYEKST